MIKSWESRLHPGNPGSESIAEINFDAPIRVSIEHGHANNLWNDYSSTAYWYQTLPTGLYRNCPEPRSGCRGKTM